MGRVTSEHVGGRLYGAWPPKHGVASAFLWSVWDSMPRCCHVFPHKPSPTPCNFAFPSIALFYPSFLSSLVAFVVLSYQLRFVPVEEISLCLLIAGPYGQCWLPELFLGHPLCSCIWSSLRASRALIWPSPGVTTFSFWVNMLFSSLKPASLLLSCISSVRAVWFHLGDVAFHS